MHQMMLWSYCTSADFLTWNRRLNSSGVHETCNINNNKICIEQETCKIQTCVSEKKHKVISIPGRWTLQDIRRSRRSFSREIHGDAHENKHEEEKRQPSFALHLFTLLLPTEEGRKTPSLSGEGNPKQNESTTSNFGSRRCWWLLTGFLPFSQRSMKVILESKQRLDGVLPKLPMMKRKLG